MALTIHDAFVPGCIQMLTSVSGMIVKAQDHCIASDTSFESLARARLAPDMWPCSRQIQQVAHHSLGAVDGVRRGVFRPALDEPPEDCASLKAMVADALTQLESLDPAELDGLADNDMRFEFGTTRLDFTVTNFLLSFSIPNIYFHAATAYDILRNCGVNLGKIDFLGRPRIKQP